MLAMLDIALSGARAAIRRLEVSAANVANVRSAAEISADRQPGANLYRPQRAVETGQAGGGVAVSVRPVEPAYMLGPDVGGVLAALPNVNLAHEAVEQRLALRAYEANLAVLRTAGEIQKSLLDATA
jgi:flagellar basal-body rod protein FlgC